jgi:intracellular sulfur oxidation DsrE/DsrF family protein
MNDERGPSQEQCNAHVDGQLDAAEWGRIAAAAERDGLLQENLSDLRRVKDLVRNAYAEPPRPRQRQARARANSWRAFAGGLMLATAVWSGYSWWAGAPQPEATAPIAKAPAQVSLAQDKVLFHVGSDDPGALARVLGEIEDLLRSARSSGRAVEVEIIASDVGLVLLSAAALPAARRVAEIRREYGNLRLVACGESIRRLRGAGRSLELLPDIAIAPSALEEIVSRLRDGWVYVRS